MSPDDHDLDHDLDHGPHDPTEPSGCGALTRASLDHVAASRIDRRVKVDELSLAHVILCRQCGDAVQHLVGLHRLRDELSQPRLAVQAVAAVEAIAPIPGYRLGEEIHRGGQGTVFAAEQLATRRACAVKTLIGGRFASSAQRMRFEREVEVVAALRHPAIVTLYESGVSSQGEPWFAMELVDGERLDAYVRRTGISPRDLAALMRRVAEAVAYAHRRGVIHRDLKPGNILIDREDAPRVLDFGLARSAIGTNSLDHRSDSTQQGEFVGTFAYAAPEQLANDPAGIDSRCDLYALGVVFYECLTGVLPFAGARSLGELVQQKTRGSVRRPSEIAAESGTRIDRDLDVIVLRLLASDPARRYDTADALVEDLARYLDGRPILAREDSVTYVVTKTIRRHWIVSGLAAVLALTVVAAGISLAVAYRRAESERARAELERARVERAYRSFRDALESADPELGVGTSEMKVYDFLAIVEKQVRGELQSEPELLAEILQTLGLIQLGFDESLRASDPIFRSYEIIAKGHAEGRVSEAQLASAATALAKLRFAQDDYAGAEASYREALDARIRSAGPGALESIDTERQLASALREQGKFGEARALLDGALVHAQRLAQDKSGSLVRAGVLNGLAVLAAAEKDDARAIGQFQSALDEIRPHVPPDDFRIGRTLYSMAKSELRIGRLADAYENARRSVEILRVRKGDAARSTQSARKLFESIEQAQRATPSAP